MTVGPLFTQMIAAFAIVFLAGQAEAQTGASVGGSGSSDPEFDGNAGAVIVNGLSITKRQDLWFGVIAPSSTDIGTVRVNRGRNNDSVCAEALTCLSSGNRSRFTIVGEPERLVTIDIQQSTFVYGPGDASMLVDAFVGAGSGNNTDWRGWQRLRGYGFSRFNVGATLHVGSNQTPGNYVGSYLIAVEYQ